MNYIDIPNIPEKPVKMAVIDGRTSIKIEKKLRMLGIELIKTMEYPGVYSAISFHPDIMIHHLGGRDIVYAPGTNPSFLNKLIKYEFNLIKGNNVLLSQYPGNIPYNAARVGKYAFHNLKYTDPVLKEALLRKDIELVQVNQGYSKCAISIVNNKSIITSDTGIAKAAEKVGIEALLIDGGENILLPGLKNGFIGGSSCLIDKYKWAVSGKLEKLKSTTNIKSFLDSRGLVAASLSDEEVIDLGSIIPLLTV